MNFFNLTENNIGIFSVFIDVVTPVFLLVFIGYIAGPRLQIEARSLSRSAYFIFIPSFTFSVISKTSLQADLAMRMITYIILVQIAVAILGFLVGKALKQSREITAAFVLIATFGNVGNFGLSLIEFRMGEEAIVPATVYFLAIAFISFVICVGVASWAQSGGVTAILSVFKTPALLALIPAMGFNMADSTPPLFLMRLTDLLGQAMIPVMLITLGVQMSEVKKVNINFNVFASSSVRLIGGPALAFLIAPFFNLEGLERSTGIIQAATPSAILASIIALEYKLVPEFVTTAVLFSTLYSIPTLTLLLAFI